MSFVVEKLSTGYGQKQIIQHLDLKLPEKEITVILGANGSGKSTLLKALARQLSLQSGHIYLNQKEIDQYRFKEFAQACTLLPQSPKVPEGMDVNTLVSKGRFMHRTRLAGLSQEDHQAIQEAMKQMGVDSLAQQEVQALSGGQRQRVWIALALASRSSTLLLDEPTTYLDIAYQVDILNRLKTISQANEQTMVVVLHDLNLALRFGTHFVMMKEGRVHAQGDQRIVTAQTIKEVYGLDCVIVQDPITKGPMVVPY